MVNLEQATTSVEWSYVAAVDSVRRSEGKSYGAPGWKVGEERERRGRGEVKGDDQVWDLQHGLGNTSFGGLRSSEN